MRRHLKTAALATFTASVLLTGAAIAHTAKTAPHPDSPWKGTNAAFGASFNTGNSSDKNGNAGLYVYYKHNRWDDRARFEGQISTSDKGLSKKIFEFNGQTRYNYLPRWFFFLKNADTFDQFSPYDFVIVNSGGLGYVVYRSDTAEFTVQGGPGSRHTKVDATGITNNDFVVEADASLIWHINENTVFQELLENDIGQPYTFTQSTTSLTTKMVGDLGMRVSFVVKRYSSIPPMSTNTANVDTTTNIALVYNFV